MREVSMNEYDKFVDFMFKNLTPEDIECINECERDNHGMYGNYMFTFYLNNPEYIIRRQDFGDGKRFGPPSKFIEGFSTLEETFNKFDEKLRKRGYLK